MTRTQDQGKDSTMSDDDASPARIWMRPKAARTQVRSGPLTQSPHYEEYVHHDEVARMRRSRMREAIIMGMRIATLTPIEEVPEAIEAALVALEGKP